MAEKPKTQTDVAMENAQEKARKIINQASAAASGVPGKIVSAGNPELERKTYTTGGRTTDRLAVDSGPDEVEVVKPKQK